ncbi:TPA: TrmB family transcriptional regulator [Candidatus Woesearchaeota archaeon]|nr:TrmB family transcriptional regulator [Candidatus Woesearchaeota archaeon]
MRFSKTELKVLEQLALGKRQVLEVARALNKDKSQIYRVIKALEQKGFLSLNNREIVPSEVTHVQLLLQQLSRQSSFIEDISGCGLKLYLYILETPRSIEEITKNTGIKPSTFFYKLKTARKRSLIKTIENKYVFNSKFWTGLNEFFIELKKYENAFDKRIPPGSVIYHKTDEGIVFSTKAEYDATPTGFSAYENYGIKIYLIDNNYYLPKKKLSKKEVFIHSLYRCERDKSIQNLIILTLFYVKHKRELSKIHHEILDNINKVLKGNKVEGYPSLSEIKDRAEVYDIKL